MGETNTTFRPEEAKLIERARGGDRRAFDELVREHLDRVWGVVWRILRHQEDTEDVVQEVFIAAYKALPGFREQARFSTWLHRIAVTRALNHLDRAGEKLRRASEGIERDESEQAPHRALTDHRPASSPLRMLEAKELMQRLRECLPRLPGGWRAALALREGEDKSYEQIAQILSVALGTVRSRLARARDALKKCIEEES